MISKGKFRKEFFEVGFERIGGVSYERFWEIYFLGKEINYYKEKDEFGVFKEQKGSQCGWGLENLEVMIKNERREEVGSFILSTLRSF